MFKKAALYSLLLVCTQTQTIKTSSYEQSVKKVKTLFTGVLRVRFKHSEMRRELRTTKNKIVTIPVPTGDAIVSFEFPDNYGSIKQLPLTALSNQKRMLGKKYITLKN